jgi:uncharacterized protein DUF5329
MDARAEPAVVVRQEIDYLLGYIGQSGCEFFRNGTWHDSKAAQAHVRGKYEFLVAQNQITTTEDFIDKAATKSSAPFGQPYAVRCAADPPVRTSQWLSAELARYRTFQP